MLNWLERPLIGSCGGLSGPSLSAIIVSSEESWIAMIFDDQWWV